LQGTEGNWASILQITPSAIARKASNGGGSGVVQGGLAKVAIAHGIDANIVHGWRKLAREAGAATVSQQFVPVAAAADFAAWTRELLR
jgi:transposase-like protein